MNLPNGDKADKIAESAYLRLASRLSMIVATLLLPVAGFFLIQTYDKVNQIDRELTNARIAARGYETRLDDHERRIGVLEMWRRYAQ